MSAHGHVSSGGGLDGCRDVGELSGAGRLGRRNLSKRAKFVLRARNYTGVNNLKRPLRH